MIRREAYLLAGAPGSGTTTLARGLAETITNSSRYHASHISMGDEIRKIASNGQDPLITEYLRNETTRDRLLPDAIVNDIIDRYFLRREDTDLFFVDGYPRTEPQIKALIEMATNYGIHLRHALITQTDHSSINIANMIRRGHNHGNIRKVSEDEAKTRLERYKDRFSNLPYQFGRRGIVWTVINTTESKQSSLIQGLEVVKNNTRLNLEPGEAA